MQQKNTYDVTAEDVEAGTFVADCPRCAAAAAADAQAASASATPTTTTSTPSRCCSDCGSWRQRVVRRLGSRRAVASSDVALAILAKFVPPVPVYIKTGASRALVANVLLTALGGLPGAVHAWYIILSNPEAPPAADVEQGEAQEPEQVREQETPAQVNTPQETEAPQDADSEKAALQARDAAAAAVLESTTESAPPQYEAPSMNEKH